MRKKHKQITKIKFIKLFCNKCKAEHIIFSRATISVVCPNCGTILSIPKGGKCKLINCTVKEEIL